MKLKTILVLSFTFISPFLLFSQTMGASEETSSYLRNILIGGLGTIIVFLLKLYIDTKNKQIEKLEDMQKEQIEINRKVSNALVGLQQEFLDFKRNCEVRHTKK